VLNSEFANNFTQEWVDSWNSHDIENIIDHYADTLEFRSPLILERYSNSLGVITTRKELKEYFLIGLNKNPLLHFKHKRTLLGVDGMTLYYDNARGGQTAEYFEFGPKGKVTKSNSCYSY